ncbi:MAG TPA: hypothetical protein VGW37_02780, partial [Terriglobia bacterium]|nr:hypothetical protein [Terriglobia bacterium]
VRNKKYMVATLAAISLLAIVAPSAWAKRKHDSVNPDDPTYKLYQLLNDSSGGKLTDCYLLANLYPDPLDPSNELQRVIRVDYDKGRFFGRLRIYVRSVGQLTPAQMKIYDAKQVFDFGESDSAQYEKINPGELGETGDLYLRASADGPLASVPITDEARQDYDMLITKYILPALQKK